MRRHATLADARGHHRTLLLLAVVLLLAATSDGIRSPPFSTDDVTPVHGQDEKINTTATLVISPQQGRATAGDNNVGGVLQEEVHATGSSLPDCSHACGACSPCNRVMVSFKCSIAEPCPMVYRCMCKGKCYPVPSS